MTSFSRLSASALASTVLLTGCVEADPRLDEPAVQTALDWAQHVCTGEYLRAHGMQADFVQLDTDRYPDALKELEQADTMAAAHYELLEQQGNKNLTEVEFVVRR
ncbi:MAG: hypothetical protein ACTHXA_11600 [Gulosibacter sp.]|uniref:hypothetical protein n=1 Tax=Gulosibacter sp. TaxID=2817531 RepID=UPI003F93669B